MLFFICAFLMGYQRIYVKEDIRAINMLMRTDISCYSLRREKEGISFCVLLVSAARLRGRIKDSLTVYKTETLGLPALIYSYRKRVGALIGVGVFTAIIVLSGSLVWRIDVKGNEKVSDAEILSYLEKLGVYEGARCKDINTYRVANECLLINDTLSYMSINMIGNRIEVVVRERSAADEEDDEDDTPSNIVASRSGLITEMEVYGGKALVSVGDTVFAGETLISGMYTFGEDRYMLVRSLGHVVAETVREFSVSIPFAKEEKRVGEVFEGEKSIIFFSKEIKISKNSGNLPAVCDTIERKERVMLFGRIPLPIWIKKTEHVTYVTEKRALGDKEALDKAYAALERELSRYEVVYAEKEALVSDAGVTVRAEARVREEIALEMKMLDGK